MLRIRLSSLALAAALVAAAAAPVYAQSGTVAATADVVTPLTVTSISALAFGNVYPGVAKTVAPADAGAGKFGVAGFAGAEVALSFTLPTTLASGANTLPIASWTGVHNTANSASGGVSFTPSTTATNANLNGTGGLWVFLGAQVTPAAAQVAGTYNSTVTMTVAYTGN
jgi:hypothetical protein